MALIYLYTCLDDGSDFEESIITEKKPRRGKLLSSDDSDGDTTTGKWSWRRLSFIDDCCGKLTTSVTRPWLSFLLVYSD